MRYSPVSNADTHTATISRLNFLLGELFAEALIRTCAGAGLDLASIELIGSHGQTIFHEGEPWSMRACDREHAADRRSGGDRGADRDRDDRGFSRGRHGGGRQGRAAGAVSRLPLFRSDDVGRVALNIGGIANITVIPAGATPEQVIAFDTGPGNMIMDQLSPPFDRDGEKARAGADERGAARKLLRGSVLSRAAAEDRGSRAVRRGVHEERHRYHHGRRT